MSTDLIRPEVKRDHWGRYLLPDPEGSDKAVPWTRVTTFAKTIADTMALSKWSQRMVAKGVAARSDLYALAAATPIEDKKTLDRLAEDAKQAAQASAGANLGTALHTFTERYDQGEDVRPPAPWNADLDAYKKALVENRITVHSEYIERIVVIPELKLAGTLDRLVTLLGFGLMVDDLKTGKDLSYSWGEIAIQLAVYSRAPLMWDPVAGRYEDMPAVHQETALVMHLPVGKARCDVYTVDIAAGWAAAQLCAKARSWRARRNLATPYRAPDVSGGQVLTAIQSATTEAQLIALWEVHDAAGRWTDEHTAAAVARKNALRT